MARLRLGVVLLLPQPLATEVDGIRRGLGDPMRERVAPHVTLVTPVNVHERSVLEALDVLRTAAAARTPLRLRIGPAATFHPAEPVVFLAVDGDLDGFEKLRLDVLRGPLERSVRHDPWVPHVTVASSLDPARIPGALDALASFAVDVTFDRIHLLQEGADHGWRLLADAPFGPPAVVGRGGLELEITASARPDPEAAALLAVDGDGPGSPVALTARRDGRVVGAAWGWVHDDVLEVADLAVATGTRNQGVGRQLLAAVEALGRERGCTAVTVAAPATGAAGALLSGSGWRAESDGFGERRLWVRRLVVS